MIYARKLAELVLSNPVLSTKHPDDAWSFRPFDALAGLTNALDEHLHHQLCVGQFGMWEDHNYCGWCEKPAEECKVDVDVTWPEDMIKSLNRVGQDGEPYTGTTVRLCRRSGMEFYPLLRPLGFPFGLVQKFWNKTWNADYWLRVGTPADHIQYQWYLTDVIDDATQDAFGDKAASRFTDVNHISFFDNEITVSAYANTTFTQDDFEAWLLSESFPSEFERSGVQ